MEGRQEGSTTAMRERESMTGQRKGLGVLAAAMLAAVSLVVGATSAAGVLVPPDPNVEVDKVTICHRTNANTNPYVINEPAAEGDVEGHADHTGPVWDETLKAQHIKWGDIIPPFTFDGGFFPGLNWDAEGEAIYRNDCQPVEPPDQEFGSLSVIKTVVVPANPVSGIPTSFTVNVTCDDEVTDVDVTFPASGGAGTPPVIEDIEAGSTCVVTELDTGSFPPGSVVTYNPAGANTTGVVVDANVNVQVGVTNAFPAAGVTPTPPTPGVTPTTPTPGVTPAATPVAPAAVTVSPRLTG